MGTSRAKKFLSAGAKVTVLSLDFTQELMDLAKSGGIVLIRGDASDTNLLDKLISNSDLVVVALKTCEFNRMIIEVARRYNAFVNLANDADETEVVVPFEAEVNGLRIAVTSEGKSGLISREALKRIVEHLSKDLELKDLLDMMYYLKRYMKSRGIPIEVRMKLYFQVFEDELFRDYVRDGCLDEARRRIEELVEVTAK